MNKPDLLVCWIKHCDYPLFRRFLRQHRDFFGKVIIYWSEHFRHMYFNRFIEKDLADLNITFLQNIPYKYGYEDWRNIATNYMLRFSDSEWVCSIEQDFFTKDWNKLLDAVTEASKTYDFLGYKGQDKQQSYQEYLKGDYVHPAFWFIKRSLLDKTDRDFSAKPDQGCDHFGLITRDAVKMGVPIWWTQNNGFPEEDTYHQGGINVGYINAFEPGFVFHRPELFYIYNFWSMKADVMQNEEFMQRMRDVDKILKEKFSNINPETDERSFFYR